MRAQSAGAIRRGFVDHWPAINAEWSGACPLSSGAAVAGCAPARPRGRARRQSSPRGARRPRAAVSSGAATHEASRAHQRASPAASDAVFPRRAGRRGQNGTEWVSSAPPAAAIFTSSVGDQSSPRSPSKRATAPRQKDSICRAVQVPEARTGSSRRAAYCRAGQRHPTAQSVHREWKTRRSGLAAAARPTDAPSIASARIAYLRCHPVTAQSSSRIRPFSRRPPAR